MMIRKTDIGIESIVTQHSKGTGFDDYTVDVHFRVYNVSPHALSESLTEIIARVEGEESKDTEREKDKAFANQFREICREADKVPDNVDYGAVCKSVGEKILAYWRKTNTTEVLKNIVATAK